MVGSIRDANRGPRAPLATLIPLLHRAPSALGSRVGVGFFNRFSTLPSAGTSKYKEVKGVANYNYIGEDTDPGRECL